MLAPLYERTSGAMVRRRRASRWEGSQPDMMTRAFQAVIRTLPWSNRRGSWLDVLTMTVRDEGQQNRAGVRGLVFLMSARELSSETLVWSTELAASPRARRS